MKTTKLFVSLSRSLGLCLLLALGIPLWGQFNSSVRGVVTDPSNSPVPAAKVAIKNVDTGISSSMTCDSGGNYIFTSLAPGDYSLAVEASGFRAFSLRATLQTAQTLDVPVKLSLLTATESVEVTGQAPILDTADSRVQTTLAARDLAALPLQGRTLFGLMGMAPGVTGLGNLSGGIPDNFQVEIYNYYTANGRSFDANLYVVDGLDITSSVRPGVMNLSPNPDSVQETSIQTDTYSVEYGRASSIVTSMTTKSGTNAFHGVLSDYFTSQQLWARTEFTTKYHPFRSGIRKGQFDRYINDHQVGDQCVPRGSQRLFHVPAAVGPHGVYHQVPSIQIGNTEGPVRSLHQ